MSIMGAGLHGSCKFKAYRSDDTKCMLCAKNKLVKNARRRSYFKLSFADKTMEGIPSYFISSISSFMILLSGETMKTTTFTPFAFLLLLHSVDNLNVSQKQSGCIAV